MCECLCVTFSVAHKGNAKLKLAQADVSRALKHVVRSKVKVIMDGLQKSVHISYMYKGKVNVGVQLLHFSCMEGFQK